MNRLSLLYNQFRESRIAVAILGIGLAVVLFATLLSVTSHGKPHASAAPAYDGISPTTLPSSTGVSQTPGATTPGATTTSAPDPTPNPKALPEEQPEILEFQVPNTTVGPDGNVPENEGTATTPMSGPTTAVALDVATKFVQEWTNTNRSRDAWITGMNQYATYTYIDTFDDVDPSVIPHVTVTGSATVRSATNPIEIIVPTDNGDLLVTISSVQLTSRNVKVIDVQPADTDNGSFGQ